MRLTLRTMLAYLEDLLEPADAEQVRKKIEESEFATNLMHRTRDVTRRLRLGAPKLQGRGMGNDANTVAEYLDNKLLSERVPDLEKICLESDVHLAEVASCHQVLALVLSKPVDIEQGMRERMYGLLNQADAMAAARTAAKSEHTLREKSERSSRRKNKKKRRPKVPEYLREPEETPAKSRPWAVLALAALLLVAASIGAFSFWPQISARFRHEQVAQSRVEPPENTAAVGNPPAKPDKSNESTSTVPAPIVTDKETTDSESSPASDDGSAQPQANTEEEAPPNEDNGKTAAAPDEKEMSDEGTEKAAADAEKQPANTEKPPANTGRQAAGRDQATTTPPKTEGRTAAKPASEKEPADEGPSSEAIGRLISEDDVLLRKIDDQWQRVAGRGTIRAGDRLIALPTYRPSITMSNGVTLQLIGGAIAALARPDADGTPDIRLTSGRLLLLTVGKPGTKIRLQAGDYSGILEFGSDEANLAVEVRPSLPEGADPEEEAAPSMVDIYLASGEVTWTDRKGKRDAMRGRTHRALGNAKAGNQGEELPLWIEDSELNPTERRASEDIEKFVRADQPAAPALGELAKHRRIENSMLAAQSLALIDEFGPIVPLLNDKAYRIAWTSQIEALRAALARGPEAAALVRKSFEAVRGKEPGDELYRMLWGFNSSQLEDGAAAQLIEWLDAPDDRLDFRVLSYWNLHHITGLGLYYQPGDPEKQRRTSIQRWKQKLESGLIVPKAA